MPLFAFLTKRSQGQDKGLHKKLGLRRTPRRALSPVVSRLQEAQTWGAGAKQRRVRLAVWTEQRSNAQIQVWGPGLGYNLETPTGSQAATAPHLPATGSPRFPGKSRQASCCQGNIRQSRDPDGHVTQASSQTSCQSPGGFVGGTETPGSVGCHSRKGTWARSSRFSFAP